MRLFLSSEAKHPDSLAKMKDFVDGFEGKRIAYIPTAANGEYIGSWKNGGSIQAVQNLGATVAVVELENYYKENTLDRINQADIIWMAGGMSGYLLYWIRRVELEKILPDYLATGKINVGSSAGSMICSKSQSLADWYIGETELGASFIPGLGLIDFEIYPHYTDDVYEEINRKWTKGTLCLLKNGEMITKDGDKIQVLGEERIIRK
ncbi:MAG: Type 1 glutamine amidotransferase-like domain-containing protein [bacterium]|nr:Type 1 glutamine amidotransferase-like domain-containing protein [bacterium]